MGKLQSGLNKKTYLLAFLGLSVFFLAGCITIKGTPQLGPVGVLGVYKTVDASTTWQSSNSFLNVEGKLLTIGDVTVNKIVMDPADHLTLYLASAQGLFYSYTGAQSWQRDDYFAETPINDVAIDYSDKCNVFVAKGNSIFRSSDCMRTWQRIYLDSRSNFQITELKTDKYPKNKNFVYAGTNTGDVLKSLDSGATWNTVKRLQSPVAQILIDKDDTRIIYVATETGGIFKTIDGGTTWSDANVGMDINQGLNQFPDARSFFFLAQDMTAKNTLILASRYGLTRTSDGGATWTAIKLITPQQSANIYSLAIDPKNAKNIYYGTDTIIYKSIDGGVNWSTQQAPTSGQVKFLLIDPQDSKTIYLGGKAIPKK
jgi:photosystem II stability/assembly factor-like uncharacterized protein